MRRCISAARARLVGSCLLVLGSAACKDQLNAPPPGGRLSGGSAGATLDCFADVRASSVVCRPRASAATVADSHGTRPSYSLTLGGQGTYVQVSTANVAYSSVTQVFSADVVVQNLTAQSLGTSDGSTVSGVKVFVSGGPTPTSGSGAITVANADGVGTFTASNQPYFAYNQILDPFSGTSAPKNWQFNVPTSVEAFTFSVLIQAAATDEVGLLRWTPERGYPVRANSVWGADAADVFLGVATSAMWRSNSQGGFSWSNTKATNHLLAPDSTYVTVTAMSGTSANDVWGVGTAGGIIHYDGQQWTPVPSPVTSALQGVWANTASDVWATSAGGDILHYDGNVWSTATSPVQGQVLWGVRGTAQNDVWAVGYMASCNVAPFTGCTGFVLHYDGTSWTRQNTLGNVTSFFDIWPVSSTDVWIVGFGGTIMHLTGTTWSTVSSGTNKRLQSVWRTGPNDMWAVGDSGAVTHFDGTAWTGAVVDPTLFFGNVWGTSPTNVWATTGNQPFHFDGTGWTTLGDPHSEAITPGLRWVWGRSASNIYAVGNSGTILHNQGSGWISEASGTPGNLLGVWGAADNDVWAVGNNNGFILHSNGSTWTGVSSGTSIPRFVGVWGSSASSVWAVGNAGTIVHWNGSSWSPQNSHVTPALYGVGGTGPNDAWAVGDSGTIVHWDGTNWTKFNSGTLVPLGSVLANAPNDVWVVAGNLNLTGVRSTLVLHYDGTSWSPVYIGAITSLDNVWGTGPNDIWIGGSVSLFHYDGVGWKRVNVNADVFLFVWDSSPTNVYVVGPAGFILHGSR